MSTTSDLARRLAAHPRFPGFDEPDHVTDGPGGYPQGRTPAGLLLRHQPVGIGSEWWWLPVLDDAATAGVLLAMLHLSQATDDAVWPHGRHWRVRLGGGLYAGPTLGEAAASALLSLWGPA